MLDRPGAAELARRLVDGESPAPPPLDAGDDRMALALAWALKDLCYAAWSSNPPRTVKAAEALRDLHRGQQAQAGAAASAREIGALADWTAAIADITRGRMEPALDGLDRAESALRELGRRGPAAQTLVPRIMALSMLGRFDAAVACAERAQAELLAHGDVRAASKVSLNLGSMHLRRDAAREAAFHYRKAAVLFARTGDRELSIMADIGIGDASTAMGDFDEALRIYARARMRAGSHGLPVLEAKVDESVALLELARGHYREALACFERARRRHEALEMPQNLAIDEKQLADAYLELRLLPEALAMFDQALLKFEALRMPDDQAWTLVQRGRALAQGGHTAQAAESFLGASRLFESQGMRVGLAAVGMARAELSLSTGDAGAAFELASEAASGFAEAGHADGHARADVVRASALCAAGSFEQARALFDATLARARALQLSTVQVRCLTGQGLAAQALGDRAAARHAFEAAAELFEDQRRALPGDDLRSAFLTDHLRPYVELLRMALQDHAREPTADRAAQALIQLDRFRARALGERLAHGGGTVDDAATQGLRERLNWLGRRVQRLDDDGESSAALGAEMRHTERELLERARRARLAASAAVPQQATDDALDLPALAVALGDDGALVEYGVVDDELFACVVTRDGVFLQRRMAAWSEVLEALRAARFQIDTLRHGAAKLQPHLDSLAARTRSRLARLHALTWAPLVPSLAGCRRVLVVPHAQLGALPFAALYDGHDWLGQGHAIAVVPSARLARRGLQRLPVRPRRALALGESSRLPHAGQEAQFVAGLFGDGQALVGTRATLQGLREAAADADVVHLACHGRFRGDNPMFSALQLHDAALTAEQAETLQLRPGIVVLSACETGMAEFASGDEAIGLVRAFLVAGAARVVAALWPVDDAVTADFMAAFYGALCQGATAAAALGVAQAQIRRRHPHPFYWAAFTLHGGW